MQDSELKPENPASAEVTEDRDIDLNEEPISLPSSTPNQPKSDVKAAKTSFKQIIGRLARNIFVMYIALGLLIASPLFTLVALRPEGPNSGVSQLYTLDKLLTATREEYFFKTADGQKLHGWLLRVPASDKVAIVHHGNAGNLLHRLFIAKHCIQAGASVFLYDYRGYGKSEGSTALTNLPEDGLAAYDFVRDSLKFAHIINYGESIGTAVANQVSQQRPCDAVILQSGIGSLPMVARDGLFFMKLYPDFVFPQPRFANVELIKTLQKPLLIVHGSKDTMVPYKHAELIFANASEPKRLVLLPECGHNDVGINDEALFDKTLSEFFASVYPEGTSKK